MLVIHSVSGLRLTLQIFTFRIHEKNCSYYAPKQVLVISQEKFFIRKQFLTYLIQGGIHIDNNLYQHRKDNIMTHIEKIALLEEKVSHLEYANARQLAFILEKERALMEARASLYESERDFDRLLKNMNTCK